MKYYIYLIKNPTENNPKRFIQKIKVDTEEQAEAFMDANVQTIKLVCGFYKERKMDSSIRYITANEWRAFITDENHELLKYNKCYDLTIMK